MATLGLLVLGLTGLGLVAPAAAAPQGLQDPAPATTDWTAETPGVPLSLEEALRATFEQGPSVEIASRRLELFQGAEAVAQGAFDGQGEARFSFERAQGQLLSTQIQIEEDRRLLFRTILDEFGRIAAEIETALADETARPAPNCDSFVLIVDGFDVCVDEPSTAADGTFEGLLRLLTEQQDDPQGEEELDAIQRQQLAALRQAYGNALIRINNELASSEVSLERLGGLPEREERKTFKLDLRWRKLLRNGIEISPGFVIENVEDNFVGKSPIGAFGGKGIPNFFTSVLGVELAIPLGQGSGRRAVEGPARAAVLNREAAQLERTFTAAESALRASLAYWNLSAAQSRAELLQAAVLGNLRLQLMAEALVAGDELPRIELSRVKARLAAAERAAAAARLDVARAAVALADVTGLEITGAADLPRATDALPWVPGNEELAAWEATVDPATAGAARADLGAARKRREAAALLRGAAERNLRRRIDLDLTLGYIGFHESFTDEVYDLGGTWESLRGDLAGPSAILNLTFDLPRGNRTSRGQLLQARSLESRGEVVERDLARRIELEARSLFQGVLEAAREVAERRSAAEAFEASLRTTEARFQAGEGSLIDTVLTEEQLTFARLDVVEAERVFASFAARFRFAMGQLVESRPEAGRDVLRANRPTIP